ncbi:hypothetical protein [Borrelia sp. HM]|uniref:hypothetical protein n=1 Tax=Borrelia sp. HM TaxID=1882662 RepID=UPI001C826434|nr:hypothetical protein [Borrelia sp. HM]
MIQDLKSKIQKIISERDKKLVELGKILKNNNVIELKKLESYTSLKLIEKEISHLQIKLSQAEDNAIKLKELYQKITNHKKNKKYIMQTYEMKLKKVIEVIINQYPNNLSLISEYKMNFTKFILAKYKYKQIEIIKFNEKINFLKRFMRNINSMLKSIINQINIKTIEKEFETKILKKYLFSESLEQMVNKFIENQDLSKEIIEEYRLINEIQSEIINTKSKIKHHKTKENIHNQNKIESTINIVQINKEAILKKIAEEFIEMSKTEKGLNKSGAINSLLESIKALNQQISKLDTTLIKTIKIEEVEKIQQNIKQLISNKESIEDKLKALNSKIEAIQNEINELDNQ